MNGLFVRFLPQFPELDIFDDQKLQSLLNGSIDGSKLNTIIKV